MKIGDSEPEVPFDIPKPEDPEDQRRRHDARKRAIKRKSFFANFLFIVIVIIIIIVISHLPSCNGPDGISDCYP